MEFVVDEVSVIFNKIKNKFLKLFKDYKNTFLILFIAFGIGFYPIIRANFNYIDDIGRVFFGYKDWNNFSRHLSCFFSNFIHADSYLTDVSPLTQIIATIFLVISAIIILRTITDRKKFSILEVISVVPLGISPYFLECISYKYDSPYMAMSILFSVIPFVFYKKDNLVYCISIIFCMLGMCMTYQAASGIFPMIVVLIGLKKWMNKDKYKDIFKFIGISILGYLIGMIIFKFCFMTNVSTYVSNSMPSFDKLIPTFVYNIKTYFETIGSDFKKGWLWLSSFVCLGCLFRMIRGSKQKKTTSLIVGCISIIVMFILSFGMYSFLETPLFRPRSMYGFCVFITLIGSFVVTNKGMYFTKFVYLILIWCFFVFSFTYGNVLVLQKEYMDFRVFSVIDDLKDLDILNDTIHNKAQISGTIGRAPAIENMPQNYKLLNRLVPITFCNSSYLWGRMQFENYYKLDRLIWDNSFDFTEDDLPILKDTIYHTIKGNERKLLIILK